MESNQEKCRQYCKFACDLGVVPFAPHIFCTQFLSDDLEKEREIGIDCGLEVLKRCDEMWVFITDEYGITEGMKKRNRFCCKNNIVIKRYYPDDERVCLC